MSHVIGIFMDSWLNKQRKIDGYCGKSEKIHFWGLSSLGDWFIIEEVTRRKLR